MWPHLFLEALFKMAPKWNQSKCPWANELVNEMWYIHTFEYYSAVTMNETWKNLENIILSEECRHKDHLLFDSTYITGPEQANLYGEKY